MFSNHESKARIANWDKNSGRKSEYWPIFILEKLIYNLPKGDDLLTIILNHAKAYVKKQNGHKKV